MPVKKIAISVPEDVLKKVDRLAKRTRNTRSGFITNVLIDVAKAGSRAEVTERINALFEDPEVRAEQTEVSKDFLRAAESDPLEDEKW